MSLPRTRNGKFIARDAIPGAGGCEPPPAPFELCGVVWMPYDARIWDPERKVGGAPIGLALAMEWLAAAQAGGDDAAQAEGAA